MELSIFDVFMVIQTASPYLVKALSQKDKKIIND